MKRQLYAKQVLIFLVDAVVLLLALLASLVIRYGEFPTAVYYYLHLKSLFPLIIVWFMVMYTAGIYSLGFAFSPTVLLPRLTGAMVVSTLLGTLYFYLVVTAPITPRRVLAYIMVLWFLGLCSWRIGYGKIARRFIPRSLVAFIGTDATAIEAIEELRAKPSLGFSPALTFDPEGVNIPEYLENGAPEPLRCRSMEDFIRSVRAHGVSIIVLTDQEKLGEADKNALFGLIANHVRFEHLPDFYEAILRRIPLGSINDLWFLEHIDLASTDPYRIVKRATDLLVAVIGMAISLPFFPFIAAAIAVGSRGPVFFRQSRLGYNGKPFTLIKFRTMRVDGNDQRPTTNGDPRVTRFGALMRASRLDEIPQLWNVLKGEMSVIGPRPERPELVAELTEKVPYYTQRLLVKPGLTGWDQVSGEYHSPSVADTYKKLQYDLYYVKNMGFFLDTSIFFKTILTVFMRAGL
ncbi:MAG: sugar transferase [Rectinemataceae bacterium]